mmetsp:Transcript_54287/g.161737  ORF Transcript_54287/g.161737 Transcript_54287/m.161737 type:complete len:160 (+) Transcript_54287:1-480(+)
MVVLGAMVLAAVLGALGPSSVPLSAVARPLVVLTPAGLAKTPAFGAGGFVQLHSGKEAEGLVAKFEGMTAAARKSPGNIAYSWGRNLADPLRFNIQEFWESYEAWFAHNSLPEVREWYSTLAGLGGLQGGMSNVVLFNVSGAASLCVREPYSGCEGPLR